MQEWTIEKIQGNAVTASWKVAGGEANIKLLLGYLSVRHISESDLVKTDFSPLDVHTHIDGERGLTLRCGHDPLYVAYRVKKRIAGPPDEVA